MTRRLLPAVAILLLCACDRAAEGRPRLQDGDIVFQTSSSAQSLAIQAATHSPYSHMGLVVFREGQPYVLEAIAHVQLTPLAAWAARGKGGRYVAKRLRDRSILSDPARLSALKEAALSFVGKPYDPYFEWSDERIYCSELVWKAFDRALGVRLGSLAALSSFDLENQVVRHKLAERFGDKVPLDEQVISPAAMFDSGLLEPAR